MKRKEQEWGGMGLEGMERGGKNALFIIFKAREAQSAIN